ncbi:MAG TPA: hypothetical protein V6D05_02845 [Stenomitos sp.]
MPALARSLLVLGLAAVSLPTIGCSADYWRDLASFSTVRAEVSAPGAIRWAITRDQISGDITDAKPTVVDPTITLTLDANSSPVTFTAAKALFNYTETPGTKKIADNPVADVPEQFFYFATQLRNPDRATVPTVKPVTLTGLIPKALVDHTDLRLDGHEELTAVVAKVSLTGSDGFGGTVEAKVNVPISISYQ